jgi:hypothetical protein
MLTSHGNCKSTALWHKDSLVNDFLHDLTAYLYKVGEKNPAGILTTIPLSPKEVPSPDSDLGQNECSGVITWFYESREASPRLY